MLGGGRGGGNAGSRTLQIWKGSRKQNVTSPEIQSQQGVRPWKTEPPQGYCLPGSPPVGKTTKKTTTIS